MTPSGQRPWRSTFVAVWAAALALLGGILITVGLASLVRGGHVAGLQPAVLALLAASAAGWMGWRIQPLVGPLLLLVAVAPLVALQPRRGRLLAAGEQLSRPLLALALLAAVPAAAYAAAMLAQARDRGGAGGVARLSADSRVGATGVVRHAPT